MASASSQFSEKQFRNVCWELQPPGVGGAGWELLVKSMSISIYWQLNQVVVGPLEARGAAARRGWAPGGWRYGPRGVPVCSQYVYMQQHQEMEFNGQKVHVILAQSTSMPQFPEKSGVLWVRQFKQRLAMAVFMYYFDSLDCPVPNWLFKWAAKVRSQEAGGEACLTIVDLARGAVSLKRCTVSALMMLF
ncbi:phosphatidylcholine transfer protein-like [Phocoena phocoena]|uniref:phosphatidylcholine transfer protein-like n=1 Tax=Phocoena phocoena TaxID=9742 RepID=UPI003307B96F